MTHEEQIAQAEQFFNQLFGIVHEKKFSYLCTIDNGKFGKPYPFDISKADSRRQMAEKAIEINDLGHNVYFAVNCSDEPPTGHQRGDASTITLQTAIITDIDIEGGNHKSGKKKKLAKDFDAAKSFLPFELSLLVHSGGGLHGYCILETPIAITAANREEIQKRNKQFIEVIRSRAGKDFQIDGVGDLPRVLRVPATKNFKGGSEDAPICHVVECNPIRFTAYDFDAKLDAAILTHEEKELQPIIKKLREKKKKSAPTPYDDIFNSPEYNIFRAEFMLDMLKTVNHNDLSYGRWLAINTACKNIGVDYAVVDAFNQCEPSNYNAEQNWRRWQKLNAPSFGIETLHGIARDLAGYREADARQAYRKQYPELFKQSGSLRELFTDDEYKFYFSDDRSDLANAIRLEKFCGSDFRYKVATKDDSAEYWLTWQNGVWTRSTEKPTVLLPAAQKLYNVLSKNAIDSDAVKIADSFKQAAKTYTAISFLRGRDSIRITAEDLDTHLNLLNCLNGVIDLQDGKFYPHDDYISNRKLHLTQQCRAVYDAAAQADIVDKFFRDIMPDEMTRRGLIRWLGYCLTGSCEEEKFLIWHGKGSNGKGVLGATILELLGDFATGINQRALLRNSPFSNDASKASTELNCLEKRRFALSEELPQKSTLNVELVKNITAGDRIPIRRLYQEEKTIKNYAKINISGNFTPTLENIADDGLKRRLLKMPFLVKFGEGGLPVDYDLKRKMMLPQNLSALFAMLVREAGQWYQEHSKGNSGLIISNEMQQATAEYFDSENFVADFIDCGDMFVRVASASVKAKDFLDELIKAYPDKCATFKKKDLIQYVCDIGGVTYETNRKGFRVFKGIGKLGDDTFDGEPIAPDDTPPPPPPKNDKPTFDETDLPF